LFPTTELGLDRLASLVVVGIVKNAGKTVAIGRLLQETAALGRPVGVLSTGMDGERRDAVFGHAKPPVVVREGMWVACAAAGLASGSAEFEVVAGTGVTTPFGEVQIARATRGGGVTLIGPRTVTQLGRVVRALRAAGADFVLVDGSIDRRSVAGGATTEATILVVGAAWSRDLSAVVAEARRVLTLLCLPRAGRMSAPWPERPDVLTHDGRRIDAGLETALGHERALAAVARREEATVVRCPGAAAGALLSALVEKRTVEGLRLVVENGARVFATEKEIERFVGAGGRLEARTPIHVAGVALNPYSPEGFWLPAHELRERLEALVPDLPVFDAIRD
jgi:hypothetical protein